MVDERDPRRFDRVTSAAIGRSGCLTRSLAFEAGVSKAEFAAAVHRGHFVPYRGVYTLAGTVESPETRVWAAVLRSGPGAVVTGPSALFLLRFFDDATSRGERACSEVYLALPRDRHIQLGGVVSLRDKVLPTMERYVRGLPVVSHERAVSDSLRLLRPDDARDILYRALQIRWTTPEKLSLASETHWGGRGNAQLRRLALEARIGSHAESERLAARLLKRARSRAGHQIFELMMFTASLATLTSGSR